MDAKIVEAYNRMMIAEDHVATTEEELKQAKADLRYITQTELPELFKTLDVTEPVAFEDGTTLSVERKVYVNVTKANHADMLAWLRSNGHGDLIKTVCAISFGRKEEEVAALFRTVVETTFPNQKLVVEQTVHPTTLKSFVEKALAKGVSLPECFGIFSPEEIVVTRPKAEKGERVAF